MDSIAMLWQRDYQHGKQLYQSRNPGALKKSLYFFERSIRSFPDSWLARDAHMYRSKIFEKLKKSEKAHMVRVKISEHYPKIKR
jgi:TolA-binding protein